MIGVMDRLSGESQRRYEAIAAYYDAENEADPALRRDVPLLLDELGKKARDILELGAGTGRVAIPLAQAGHRVVAVDAAADMLEIAARKRDFLGIRPETLEWVSADILDLRLSRRFDWVCLMFNTLLNFTTLEQQDRVLRSAVRHLRPRGRLWVDIVQPSAAMLGIDSARDLEPTLFFVPETGESVMKLTDIRRLSQGQGQRVTFRYESLDPHGRRRRRRVGFDMTFFSPRELRLLLERHGFAIEQMYGNYDRRPVDAQSPRILARVRLKSRVASGIE